MAWMPRLGLARTTKAGKDYYKRNRQQFIVNIPAIAYTPEKAGSHDYVMCTVGHIRGGDPVRMIVPHDVEAADLEQDAEGIKPALLEETMEWIRGQTIISTENGDIQDFHGI